MKEATIEIYVSGTDERVAAVYDKIEELLREHSIEYDDIQLQEWE